jgi:uncharacterized surface protein with fasciclin (FAS1) repeats
MVRGFTLPLRTPDIEAALHGTHTDTHLPTEDQGVSVALFSVVDSVLIIVNTVARSIRAGGDGSVGAAGFDRSASSPMAASVPTLRKSSMTKAVRFARICLTVALFAVITAAGAARSHAAQDQATQDIVDTLFQTGGFNTLLKGLQVTGLEQTLKGPGPFTVFAPTDQAFAVLGEDGRGRLEAIFAPENRAELAALLANHVVPGKMSVEGITAVPTEVRTVGGKSIKVLLIVASIYVNHYGRIQQGDIPASNGIIHVIDRVIVPEN